MGIDKLENPHFYRCEDFQKFTEDPAFKEYRWIWERIVIFKLNFN
jgi:hypothetical protein